jgi:hypothetical protein
MKIVFLFLLDLVHFMVNNGNKGDINHIYTSYHQAQVFKKKKKIVLVSYKNEACEACIRITLLVIKQPNLAFPIQIT